MLKKISLWKGILIFIPIPFIIAFTNFVADPGNIFHDVSSREAAQQIAKGKAVYSVGNFNERNVKFNLIQFLPENVDCLVFGPSLSMGIRSHDVGTDNFFNLGESDADFYDIMAQFGALEFFKKNYKRVVICVDFDYFCETYIKQNIKDLKYKPYALYMIDVLNHKNVVAPNLKSSLVDKIISWMELLSISYFQSSTRILLTNLNDIVLRKATTDRIGTPDESYDGAYYKKDASWVYAKSFQAQGLNFVLNDIKKYQMTPHLVKKEHLRKESVEVFEKLINYLQTKDVDIELYLCPFPPTLWNKIDRKEYVMVDELEEYAKSIAKKYNLKLTGAYDPNVLGVSDEDFYDSRHLRHEKLSVFMDFKP